MSNSIAAAKRRRAGVIETTPTIAPQQGPVPVPRLTLPQVISMLDARLVKLEKYSVQEQSTPEQSVDGTVSVSEYVVEMDHKFSVLVDEISNLKDIVLRLQSFTMEVNKILIDKHIQTITEFQIKNENIQIENENIQIEKNQESIVNE